MEFQELVDACMSAGYEVRSYSGRGIYGQQCLGIDTDDSPISVVLNIVSSVVDNESESRITIMNLCDALKEAKTDSMGKGMIIYFPGIKWEEPAEFDDEETDSEEG